MCHGTVAVIAVSIVTLIQRDTLNFSSHTNTSICLIDPTCLAVIGFGNEIVSILQYRYNYTYTVNSSERRKSLLV